MKIKHSNSFLWFPCLLFLIATGCKEEECPKKEHLYDLVPMFGFKLLHQETGLPLVADDTSITTYPPGSVKLVNRMGKGWGDITRDNPPNGHIFGMGIGGYNPPPNDTLLFYLHFLTTGDVDTIKIRKILYVHNCRRAFRMEYFYNNKPIAIDTSQNVNSAYRMDFLTLYKKP